MKDDATRETGPDFFGRLVQGKLVRFSLSPDYYQVDVNNSHPQITTKKFKEPRSRPC